MTGLDIAQEINSWTEKSVPLTIPLFIDFIPKEGIDAGCLRYDPAPAAEKRFLDGSRLVKWNLTYYVKCSRAEKAREYANQIINKLDGVMLHITRGSTAIAVKLKAVTLPQYIGKDAKNYTTYSTALSALYLITP